MARTNQPPYNQVSKGAAGFKFALLDPEAETWLFTTQAAPVNGVAGDGAGWAGTGSLLLRTDAGNAGLFINSNTRASPTWTAIV